jgi:hypothetical protein
MGGARSATSQGLVMTVDVEIADAKRPTSDAGVGRRASLVIQRRR